MKKTCKILAICLTVVCLLASCTAKAPVEETTTESVSQVSITIECSDILKNSADLKAEKSEFVPSDGVILKKTEVTLVDGESAFDLLLRVCKENDIQLEHEFSSSFNSEYVEGIGQLYSGDCGEMSGWTFLVNGESSQVGASQAKLADGDEITWSFVCSFE